MLDMLVFRGGTFLLSRLRIDCTLEDQKGKSCSCPAQECHPLGQVGIQHPDNLVLMVQYSDNQHKLGYDSHAVPITLSAPVWTLTQVGGPRKETYTFPAKESDQIMRTCQSLRCLAVSTCSKNSPRWLFGPFLVTIRRRKA